MNTQPLPLYLAENLESGDYYTGMLYSTATELRRLHEANEGWQRDYDLLEADNKRLHEVNQELVSWLSEAVILIGDWGAYASECFQNKYDLQGDINRINAIIAKATGETK